MEKTLFDGPHFELDELARRLAAQKTPVVIFPGAGSGVWDDATKANLRVLWAEGHSATEIGRRLGFSKNAIVGKAHRLGVAARESPIAKGFNNRAPRPLRIVGSTLPPLASLIEPLPVFQDAPPRRPEPPVRRHAALPVSGVPAAPRPVPCPYVPRPAREPVTPASEPVTTDLPTIRAWAGQRGIISHMLDLDIVNRKRFDLGLAPFALEPVFPRKVGDLYR